jgi:proteic killer suppression protein
MVDAAAALDDLKSPPGNKLHELQKERKGQHAI